MFKLYLNMKLQCMNNKQFFITLPNQIVRAKGWIKGDKIDWRLDEMGNLCLKKVIEGETHVKGNEINPKTIPKGSFSLAFSATNLKLVNINWAVSGLRNAVLPSIGPTLVLNIKFKSPKTS